MVIGIIFSFVLVLRGSGIEDRWHKKTKDEHGQTIKVPAANYGKAIVTGQDGRAIAGPWVIERAVRDAREQVDGLPEGFRFHDLQHYFASMFIVQGLDVKVVQARLRHASAKTTLDTDGHLWPTALTPPEPPSLPSTPSDRSPRGGQRMAGNDPKRLGDSIRASEPADDLVFLL